MAEYIKLKDAINEAMMIGIKPCPFCGGVIKWIHKEDEPK